MPGVEAHEGQYKKNLRVVEILRTSDNPPYDWIVTLYFYAALHLVERALAKHNHHSTDHVNRNEKVRSPLFQKITPYYESLYIESQNARYECVEMTLGKVKVAKSHLEAIEKQLLK